jgi:hypothetical protein
MAVAGFGQGFVLSPLFGAVLAGVPAELAHDTAVASPGA